MFPRVQQCSLASKGPLRVVVEPLWLNSEGRIDLGNTYNCGVPKCILMISQDKNSMVAST